MVYPNRKPVNTLKFMQVLDRQIYARLRKEARSKGINVQELIRAIIIPEHLSIVGEQEQVSRAGQKLIEALLAKASKKHRKKR